MNELRSEMRTAICIRAGHSPSREPERLFFDCKSNILRSWRGGADIKTRTVFLSLLASNIRMESHLL